MDSSTQAGEDLVIFCLVDSHVIPFAPTRKAIEHSREYSVTFKSTYSELTPKFAPFDYKQSLRES